MKFFIKCKNGEQVTDLQAVSDEEFDNMFDFYECTIEDLKNENNCAHFEHSGFEVFASEDMQAVIGEFFLHYSTEEL